MVCFFGDNIFQNKAWLNAPPALFLTVLLYLDMPFTISSSSASAPLRFASAAFNFSTYPL